MAVTIVDDCTAGSVSVATPLVSGTVPTARRPSRTVTLPVGAGAPATSPVTLTVTTGLEPAGTVHDGVEIATCDDTLVTVSVTTPLLDVDTSAVPGNTATSLCWPVLRFRGRSTTAVPTRPDTLSVPVATTVLPWRISTGPDGAADLPVTVTVALTAVPYGTFVLDSDSF